MRWFTGLLGVLSGVGAGALAISALELGWTWQKAALVLVLAGACVDLIASARSGQGRGIASAILFLSDW